jgi:FkbM family methyltransferase
MFRVEQNKVLVQIGTNNGADEFNCIVKYANPSKVILVEPNQSLNGKIFECYKGIRNVYVENVAITEVNKGKVKLVIPKNLYNRKGVRMSKWNFYDVHYSLLPMDDWGTNFHELEATSMTFEELCEKHEITDIGFLQIDTEGYDAEIIKSIDFRKHNIDIIKFEDWSFPIDRFSRYGDKAKKYGVNGIEAVKYLLANLGYSIEKDSSDFVATRE